MSATIGITPRVALVDVPRHIVLAGFAPCDEVLVTAHLAMADGSHWTSENRFNADAQGIVDLTRDAPFAGDYADPVTNNTQGSAAADPMGIVWSMRCVKEAPPKESIDPLEVAVEARDTHGNTAQAVFEQHFVAEGVTRRAINEDGVIGSLFLPATPGPHPAVVVMNGSGGGINEPRAALYAAHGYAAFALGYFNAPGLPPTISRMPLEYFARALDWLRATVSPAGDFVAVTGQSRGGELSLLLASI